MIWVVPLISGCSTLNAKIDAYPVLGEKWKYELTSAAGGDHTPERVRDAFESKAKEVCGSLEPTRLYRIVEIRKEPKIVDPHLDLPQNPYNSMLAKKFFDIYDTQMDGIVECVLP